MEGSVEVGEHSKGRKEEPSRSPAPVEVGLPQQTKGSLNAGHQWSKLRAPPLEARSVNSCRGEDGANKCPIPSSSLPSRESYKDVLMKRPEQHYPAPYPQRSNLHTPYPFYPSRGTPRRSLAKRCHRCLASDHVASACRDPVRCWRCWKTGHRAFSCRGKSTTSDAPMDRVDNRRGRAALPKVFVPYTEEYLRRVELRRNAVLADIIQPANLGQDPITVIKTALASRFGGYVDDFAVARYRDRDFAIFLPKWVPADLLIRREIITLNGFWLRCWPWGQYRYARPHRVLFKAWIRLVNLPFEIWTVARVAALVSSFGRFIKADSATKAMTDLRAFRCQIALDSINNVPENLSVIVGEELFPVRVHLERWERTDEGGAEVPPAPPRDDQGGAEAQVEGGHDGGGANPVDEDMEDAPGEVEEADPAPQTRRSSGISTDRNGPTVALQVGSAARLRSAAGRRIWVALRRGGSGIEAMAARETRTIVGSRSPEFCMSSEGGKRGSPLVCLTPSSSLQVRQLLLQQGLPREEGISSLEGGGPEAFMILSQTSGFKSRWVTSVTWSTPNSLTFQVASNGRKLGDAAALGPGPLSVGCVVVALGLGPYSGLSLDPSLDLQLWAALFWRSRCRARPYPAISRSASPAHSQPCDLGLGLLSDLRPSPLPAMDSGRGLLFDPRPSPLLLLKSGLGPLADSGLSSLSDSSHLVSGLAQLAPELDGVREAISDLGLAQHPPGRAEPGRGHLWSGQLLLEETLDLGQHSGLSSPGDKVDSCSSPSATAPQPEFASPLSFLNWRDLYLRRRTLRLPPRKARLIEGATPEPGTKARKLTRKRVKSKSLLCGVDLSDAEASELRRFIRAGA
uniref:CCHC-type domain-containing protein n=1 Tax=Ananas comosus var. bracteatus TaxID=296719 RepID=A0A6V7PPB5_ANACO|nr:unnamed protein product [Ananas comosus var. bracteatus]